MYNIKLDCNGPNLSAEDILRLIVLTNGSNYAIKIVKV